MKKLLLVAAAAFIGLSASADVITTLDGITLTTDTSNPTYYFIKNLRNHASRGQTYASTPSGTTNSNYTPAYQGGQQVKLMTTDELNATDGRYDVGSLWYFVKAGDDVIASEKTFRPVNIYNAYTGQCINNPQTGTWGGSSMVWCLVENTSDELTGFSITTTAKNLDSTGNSWNNASGGSELIGFWSGNDVGSIWGVETVDATKAAATLAAFEESKANDDNVAFSAGLNDLKSKGDEVVSKISGSFIDATAWNAAKAAATEATEENVVALRNAFYTMFVDGKHFTFKSAIANEGNADVLAKPYVGVNDTNDRSVRIADAEKAIFTLEKTDAGYYLKNEYTGKYFKHATANNQPSYLVATKAEASVYHFETNSATPENQVGIICAAADPKALNVNKDIQAVTRWNFNTGTAGSFWLMEEKTDVEAAKAALKGAIDVKSSLTSTGSGVGQYSLSKGSADIIAAATAVYENADAEKAAIEEAAASVNAIVRTLNMPVAGRFYRIIGSNGQYLAATATNAAGRQTVGDDTNGAETVYYYDGQHLVSLRNGLVLGNYTDGYKEFVHVNSTGASSIVFKEGQVEGKYLLQTATNVGGKDFFIFGANNNSVDRGSLDAGLIPSSTTPGTTSNYQGYFWTIEELAEGSGSRWLPLYVGTDAKHVTVYSPVKLTNSNSRIAEVHTLYVNSEKNTELVKTPIDEKVIPANTPCYVVLADGAVGANGSVYLPFNYTDAAEQANDPNALTGSFYATQKDSSTSYFTVGVDETDSAVRFLAHSAEYIPGFTAHYAVTENPAEKYDVVSEEDKTSTGISEVVAGGENGAKVIYDLQGRRVADASKGIFIINGVKTLVK